MYEKISVIAALTAYGMKGIMAAKRTLNSIISIRQGARVDALTLSVIIPICITPAGNVTATKQISGLPEQQRQRGHRFLDPCQPDDDHELHWIFHPDGTITPLTSVAKYTQAMLVLERPILQIWRQRMHRLRQDAENIRSLLADEKALAKQTQFEQILREIEAELEPDVFDRPRGAQRRQIEANLEASEE